MIFFLEMIKSKKTEPPQLLLVVTQLLVLQESKNLRVLFTRLKHIST
jgi:hypothetical protein